MNVSLKEFLKTGRLGQIQLGTPAQGVLDLLGEPEGDFPFGDLSFHGAHMGSWTYGNLTVRIGDGDPDPPGVWSIEWYPLGEDAKLPVACVVEDWEITEKTEAKRVQVYLEANGIGFRKRYTRGYYPQNEADTVTVMKFTTYFLTSGVKITFCNRKLTSILIYHNGLTKSPVA